MWTWTWVYVAGGADGAECAEVRSSPKRMGRAGIASERQDEVGKMSRGQPFREGQLRQPPARRPVV